MIILFFYLRYYIYVNFIFQLLFIFLLSNYFLYVEAQLDYPQPINKHTPIHFLIEKLPSIKTIDNYFYYKTNISKNHPSLIYYEKIIRPLLEETSDELKLRLILEKAMTALHELKPQDSTTHQKTTSNFISSDYIPAKIMESYFPNNNPEEEIYIPYSPSFFPAINHHPISTTTIPFQIPPTQSPTIPLFQITIEEPFEKAQLLKGNVLDNNLPFETPVNIVVKEDPDIKAIIFANTYPLQMDMYCSIYGPSHVGIRMYDSDSIFQLHLDIKNIIERNLYEQYNDHISEKDIPNIVKNMVHNYIQDHQLLSNVTKNDLKNANHLINLLLHEFIINSIFTEGIEQLILQNAAATLIIDVFCHLDGFSWDDYINNPDIYDLYIKQIITRFLPR